MSSYMSWAAANAPPTQHSDVSMDDYTYYENVNAQLNSLPPTGPQTLPGSASIVNAMNRRIESLPSVISISEPIRNKPNNKDNNKEPIHRTRSKGRATTPPPPKEVKETRAEKAARTKAEKAEKAAAAAEKRAAANANARAEKESERVRLAVKFERILTSGTFDSDEAREAYLLSVFDGELPEELVGLSDYDLITAATEMIVSKIMDGDIEESDISDMSGGANNNNSNYRSRRPTPINTGFNTFNPRNTNNFRPNNLEELALDAPRTPRRNTRRNAPSNVRANRRSLLRRNRSRNTIRQPDFTVEERVLPRGSTDAITWELIKDGEEMVDIKMTDTYNSELIEPLYYTYETYRGLHGKHPQSRRPISATARFYTARIPPENINSSYGSNNTNNTRSTRRPSRRPSRRHSNVNNNMNGGSNRTRKNRKHK